jgi:DNA-binding transcriptional LysR family regulator
MVAAANALGVAQSSVVRQLAALEEALSTPLLVRSTRRLYLTEEGREYYQRCRQILHELEEAETALIQRQSKPAGLLRITAPVTFGRKYLAPLIHRFLLEFPDMEIELILLDRIVDLLEEGIDIALRIGPLPDSTLIAKPLGRVSHVICASPEYIAQRGEPVHPTALNQHDCIHLSAINNVPEWPFRVQGSLHKITISGRFKTNHIETAIDACCNGLGYARFLSYQVAELICCGRLRPVLTDFVATTQPVNLVYPHSRQLSSRSRAFIDWVQPQLQQQLTDLGLASNQQMAGSAE